MHNSQSRSTGLHANRTTFRYDRLGTGLSEHPGDAYNVVQGATDLAVLSKVASGLRDGSLLGTSYNKIVGVGCGP